MLRGAESGVGSKHEGRKDRVTVTQMRRRIRKSRAGWDGLGE